MLLHESLLSLLAGILIIAEGPAAKLTPADVERLVARLGSDSYRLREQASARLVQIDEALPALRRALLAPDLEVRRRAKAVLAAAEARRAERLMQTAVAQVNDEGFDLFIDRMVLEPGYAEEGHWKAAVQLARALAGRAAEAGARVAPILEQPFHAMPEAVTISVDGHKGARVRSEGAGQAVFVLYNALFLSSGPLESISTIDSSIVFVDGDIGRLNAVSNAIVFCRGSIKSINFLKRSLFVCTGSVDLVNVAEESGVFVRGPVQRMNTARQSVVEAASLGQGKVSEGNVYRNCPGPTGVSGVNNRVEKATASPLELFRLFEPARVGLEFTMLEGSARVERATAGQPFARAGLRPGDRVLAVNGTAVPSGDALIGLLRRRVAAGEALLRVQRADQVLALPVRFEP